MWWAVLPAGCGRWFAATTLPHCSTPAPTTLPCLHCLQTIAAGMFLDGLPQTLTPLALGGAGAPDVQMGLRKTLRAVLDVQVGGEGGREAGLRAGLSACACWLGPAWK